MSDPSQTERIYCAQQINIPPSVPRILKVYAKAAIRTQPYDLLRWTAAYFRALANGEVPPAKNRLEYPPFIHPTGITPGYLRTLLDRFGRVDKVPLKALLLDWRGLDLSETSLYRLLHAAALLPDGNENGCDFYRFLAVACGFLGNNLLETMIYVCELLTREPEGGSAMIPLRIFLDLYGYLANLDCGGEPVQRREEVDSTSSNEEASVSGPSSETTIDSTTTTTTICSCEFTSEVEKEVETTTTSDADEDVCGRTPREKRASESLEILKDHEDDPNRSDVDAMSARQSAADDKTEIGIESIHGHNSSGEGGTDESIENAIEISTVSSIADDTEYYEDPHEKFLTCEDVFDLGENGIAGEAEAIEGTIASIDLECECRRLGEAERGQTSPTVADPLKEFLKRMRAEVEAGRLETFVRIPGIGPPISTRRVTAVGLWLTDCARRQGGLVGPRNIRHFLCPNLDDVPECVCT